MRAGTHRDLLFWHAVQFAQIHRWSQGPVETCNSGPEVAVLHAENHRWGLVPIEICYSGAKHAVLCAQIHRWSQGPIETCNSGPKGAVLHAQPLMRAGTHRDLLFWC